MTVFMLYAFGFPPGIFWARRTASFRLMVRCLEVFKVVPHSCFKVPGWFLGCASGMGALWSLCGFTLSSQFIKRLLFLSIFSPAAFVINSFNNHFKRYPLLHLKSFRKSKTKVRIPFMEVREGPCLVYSHSY